MFSHDEQTIIAQCTPKGSGAIALLRLSGAGTFSIADRIAKLPSCQKISSLPSHTIHFGSVISPQGTIIDQVLFLIMRNPRSFTGQDTIEITCHNNSFIVEAIIASSIAAGARTAQEGEFSKRAVLNGKIDLLQAEAINELIHANNEQALKQSLAQLQGSFSSCMQQIEKKLLSALAFTNASFEFIEEENLEFGSTIKETIDSILQEIAVLKSSFDQQKQLRNGIRVALIGSVNAGKSSLFNKLIGHNRAIVTDLAGTTRDAIEAGFYENGHYWTLIDTAGLRNTNDIIEQEGIRRSYHEATTADIILLIIDGSRPLSSQEEMVYKELYTKYQDKIIPVLNKADLLQATPPPFADTISTANNNPTTISALKKHVFIKAAQLFENLKSPYLLNQRQFNLLIELEQKLEQIKPLFKENTAYELVAYHINEAIAQCGQITGKTVSEQAMDAVFKEFCVGK